MHAPELNVSQLGIAFSTERSADKVIGVAGVHTRKLTVVDSKPTFTVMATDAALAVSVPSSAAVVHAGDAILMVELLADEQVMPVLMVATVPAGLIPRTLMVLVTAVPVRIAVLTSSPLDTNAKMNRLAGLPMFTTPAVLSPRRSTASASVGTLLPPGLMAVLSVLLKKLIVHETDWTPLTVAFARTAKTRVIKSVAGWTPVGAVASFFKLAEILALCPLITGDAVQVFVSTVTDVIDRSYPAVQRRVNDCTALVASP